MEPSMSSVPLGEWGPGDFESPSMARPLVPQQRLFLPGQTVTGMTSITVEPHVSPQPSGLYPGGNASSHAYMGSPSVHAKKRPSHLN
eukprot:1977494-Karenia_brevis.AAC.1